MSESGPYGSASAVEAAIHDAADKASTQDHAISVSKRIRQEHFRRFLSRVFSEGSASEWLLKGGTGMLARVPSGRTTKDVDLYRSGFSLDQALIDLRRLSQVDLGDHFRFVYTGHTETLAGGHQPYTDGYRVSFDIYIGAQKHSRVNVDLAVGAGLTTEVTHQTPENGLTLPRLVSHDYRLYPVVDQIADKVCATVMLYSGKPSSREKDLVDLVILAATQEVDGCALHRAIHAEVYRRGLEPFSRFTIPAAWGAAYARMAKEVPVCADFRTVSQARALMAEFIDPILTDPFRETTWSPRLLGWTIDDANRTPPL